MFCIFFFFLFFVEQRRQVRPCVSCALRRTDRTSGSLPPFPLPCVPPLPLLSPAEFSPFLPSSIAVELCVHARLK